MIDNFIIKEKKQKEFQDWIKANEETFVAMAKKMDAKYLGTYYYDMGTGAHVNANACWMWELSKYGDIDAALTMLNDPTDE